MTSQSGGVTSITANNSQPFLFAVSMDSTKKKIKIQAKNKHQSTEQYYSEFIEDNLKKIGFHSSIKGFYNRLKMAIESRSPNELKAYYSIKSSSLRLILEEISKFDDESTKWTLSLKRKRIERVTDDSLTAGQHSTTPNGAGGGQIDFVVKQFKAKFASEKEERLKLEERIHALEELCSKLTRKVVKVTADLKKERERAKDANHSDDVLGSPKSKV